MGQASEISFYDAEWINYMYCAGEDVDLEGVSSNKEIRHRANFCMMLNHPSKCLKDILSNKKMLAV